MPDPVVMSNAGVALPLGPDFDHELWMRQPPDLPIPVGMDLQERNQHNYDTQLANRISIRATRAHLEATKNNTVGNKDVGPKLKAYYIYTRDEMEDMVSSQYYCEHVVAPIPPMMADYIVRERRTRAKAEADEKKKKEEEKAAKEKDKATSLLGSMVMSNPIFLNATSRAVVSTPDIFLASIVNQNFLPIFWFTDERLRFATENPHQIPVKHVRPISNPSADKIALVDTGKLAVEWGGDDSADDVSVHCWVQASLNFLAALKRLCPAANPNDPSPPPTFAGEMEKHRNFFLNLDDFEKDFPVWYPVEKKLCNRVLNKACFDATFWSAKVDGSQGRRSGLIDYPREETIGPRIQAWPSQIPEDSASRRQQPFLS
ncbi:hypothetical protein B0H11DRAFT_1899941 [Mycena galericulata]|nr:hypothetical protein B0H11DRAFT_1899941 [Mycena galericulata]